MSDNGEPGKSLHGYRYGDQEGHLIDAEAILQHRVQGMTIPAIARMYNTKVPVIQARIQTALEWRLFPLVDQYRALEDARLDDITQKLELIMHAPSETGVRVEHRLQAIASLIRVSERRAKLNGLDSPIKINTEITHEVTVSEDLMELIEAAKKKAEEERALLSERASHW